MSSAAAKERGNQLYKTGNYSAAIDEYTTAIDLAGPDDFDLHITYSNRCACNLKLNNYNCALEDALACTRLKPCWSKGFVRLGTCLIFLKRYSEAVTHLEKALEVDSSNSEAQLKISEARSLLRSEGGINYNASSAARSQHNYDSATDAPSCGSGASRNSYSSFASTANSSSASSANSTPNSRNGSVNGSPPEGQNNEMGDILTKITDFAKEKIAQGISWWQTLSDEHRQYVMIGLGVLLFYWLFLSGSSYESNIDGGYSRSRRYYGGSGYSSYRGYDRGYGGGMGWTLWGAIVLGAWKLPPMFPDLLGRYAQPFFGMNLMTFMWLLRMVSGGGGGMMMYGGHGGMFNNRRRYF